MPLTLADAERYMSGAMAKAKQLGVRVSCAVVDEFGELVQVDRMDGASPMTVDIAEAKARTALNFRRPTSSLSSMDPNVLDSIKEVVKFTMLPIPGGVPIMVDGVAMAGVGVSGATGEQDEEIASAGASG
jgi:glc operon protein GlcG